MKGVMPPLRGRHRAMLLFAVLFTTQANAAGTAVTMSSHADARIEAMKINPRGPFSRIRWYCKDGTELPPTPSACIPHGGGSQHGEWSPSTLELRAAGYRIANVYATLDVAALLAEPRVDEALGQMIVERFLFRVDDGWIMRRGRHYRGALQEEGERAAARRMLLTMAGERKWIGNRYLALRTLTAFLPHGADTTSAKSIRQTASNLAQRDTDFVALKNKIHISPAADDAAAVRDYAAGHDDPEIAAALLELAAGIDALYAVDTASVLADLSSRSTTQAPALATLIDAERDALSTASPAQARFHASGRLLRGLREALPGIADAGLRLRVLDASLLVEAEHFVAATALTEAAPTLSRREQLELLGASADANYGSGLLSARQLAALEAVLAGLDVAQIDLPGYRKATDYLGLAPGWADRHLNFAFADGMATLAEIEPLARLFIQDHLRGSPMFFYAALIDALLRDANRLAGVRHRLFERDIGSGLRALNPGITRGVLRDGRNLALAEFDAQGIYLLPETIAELPPVAGILTAGEGNPLSHVQLLARNLGIPNVAVAGSLLDVLAEHQGERVVLAVSGGGAVRLMADDSSFDALFAAAADQPRHLIEPELDKLDLGQRAILDLADLRASDSGRTVGPKAAKLGELKAHYPQAVANGLALPFGIFRALLERAAPDGSGSMYDYIVAGYRALEALPEDSVERETATENLRAAIETWVAGHKLAPELQAKLRQKLIARLGADGSFGVFVRSDTNVEDLPGFTGAGLNLTVPNVVGIDNIIAAIPRVWASPFTARAFSWRQALMREPEHVYPAVLLLESVNADKSGVLVTQDIDSGDRGWISVAVNEGVGGAVDGQSAESLRIELASGRVRLLAQASASIRRQVAPAGGVVKLPASGAEAVLQDAEIAQLIAFARALPEQFPAIVDAAGEPAPADVEFGFQDGRLRLFQIRPFLDNPAARGNQYLLEMDPDPASLAEISVDLTAAPQ